MLGSTQQIQLFQVGGMGGVAATGTGIYTGQYGAVKFLQDASASIIGNIEGLETYSGVYIAGDVVFGVFNSVQLTSGVAILYKC